jgi:hypothetical protein
MDLMSKVIYQKNSPYFSTPQTSWYISNFVFRRVPPDSADVPFTLKQQHQYRPDTLSNDLYGTPAYYWVFCVRNPFLRGEPIWGFVAGLTIMVPSANHIQRVLGN